MQQIAHITSAVIGFHNHLQFGHDARLNPRSQSWRLKHVAELGTCMRVIAGSNPAQTEVASSGEGLT